jgi:hypothetical protein
MKNAIFAAMAAGLVLTGTSISADAKGCIKGALVGGVAGHYAGHHGLLGAAAGCAIGRHRANQAARENNNAPRSTTGSSNSATRPARY